MKTYDEAAGQFYNKINISPVPLISWDIHSSNFLELCESGKDIFYMRNIAERNRWAYPKIDSEPLKHGGVVVITNPELTIVHITSNVASMTGYKPEEVIGNTPKIFQGKETDQKTLAEIKTAIQRNTSFEAVVLNYKKDGSTYNCEIKAEPIFNNRGQLVNYIAYEKEVA